MYVSSTLHRGLIIGGIALLAVVGLIGWTRSTNPSAPQPLAANTVANPEPVAPAYSDSINSADRSVTTPYPAANPSYGSNNPYGEVSSSSSSSRQVVYGASPFTDEYGTMSRPAYAGAPAYATGPAYAAAPAYAEVPAPAYSSYATYNAPPPSYVTSYRAAPRRVYVTRRASRRRYVVVRKRPWQHSAMIIGGSAAGGALIGGLAGGGKGAGIGALAGGAGGLVYDRLTHKKTYVVEK